MLGYVHKVHYYETDKMGITHHSNYIRWMEEARVAFLNQIGWGYAKLEDMGIISPVLGITGEYKRTTTFDDEIEIEVRVSEFKGVKMTISYEFKNKADNNVVFVGTSRHCFLDANGRPVNLKKNIPNFYEKILELIEES